jgi:pyruvate dehydrogenase (quinone)
MSRKSVAEMFVDTLVAYGVQRVYGVAGDSLNGLTESIRARKDIRWVHVRHEETAAFAAGAEAHLTGGLAVCAGSCGPGNLHLVNGLYDAHRSRVPVLAIAAHIPSNEVGTRYFQETHPEQIFRECSEYCELISQAEQMPRVLEIALRTSLARRAVSTIVISGDVALRTAPDGPVPNPHIEPQPSVQPSDPEIARLAGLLNGARKITILGGAGCAAAHAELVALAGALRAPIVHAMRGKEFIEFENPFDVGMTGLLGFSSGYRAMKDCDLLLMLGTDFPYSQFYPDSATVVQVDIRGEQIGRRGRVDLGLVGDVGATIRALLPRLAPKTDAAFLTTSLDHYRKARQKLDDLATGEPGHRPIHPQYVAKVLSELASPSAIFTCDVGTPTIWAARYLAMNGSRRLVGSFAHGSMAGALPQAIGAQATFPDRQVIAMSGDGGLAMLLGDLLSLQQLRLPVKVVVFDNGSLDFVQLEMQSAGLIPFGVDLVNPDFSALAQTAGVRGWRVEDPEQVRPMMQEALAHPGPALLDVLVSPLEIAVPPSIQSAQVKGMGLYLLKAVLSGRGDEVVDLAKTNLFRGESAEFTRPRRAGRRHP